MSYVSKKLFISFLQSGQQIISKNELWLEEIVFPREEPPSGYPVPSG